MRLRSQRWACALSGATWALAACEVNPLNIGSAGDGEFLDGGGDGGDGAMADALGPDAMALCEAEVCNQIDDDCDGTIDDNVEGAGEECGLDVGACEFGATACIEGKLICQGGVGPAFEACDEIDNNCDGEIDEGYDFNTVMHCGSCEPCDPANAEPLCDSGTCLIADCDAGFVDFNADLIDGCEYECTPTSVIELCDGLDDDCDMLIDQDDPDFVDLEENPCVQLGGCAGTTASCAGEEGWVCDYPAGFCPGCAEVCDSVDNDCDVAVDEIYNVEEPCDDGLVGQCRGTGAYQCTADGTATECIITAPGAIETPELCNGLDDDCDGAIDESGEVVDEMVLVSYTSTDFYIYTYEASRPDATVGDSGLLADRACSKSGVLPWSNLDRADAEAACEAAGKHLCTRDEWGAACEGSADDVYPYGDTYEEGTCNGNDYDVVPGGADEDASIPTGTLSSCVSDDGAFDMSGNLKEWTDDPFSDGSPPDPDGYIVRGGSYDNADTGLACDFDFTVLPPNFAFDNLGFRCCCVVGVDDACP